MNGKVLLDSNIIVYLSKNELDIDKVFDDKKRYFISIITYMETLGFNFQASDEKDFVRKILSLFELVYIDKKIAEKVIEIRQNKRVKLPDAIIAATAIIKRCDLITRNTHDFKGIDNKLNVVNPF